MTLLLLLACAADEAAWVVQHGSVIPTESGLEGTQTWEFFGPGWTPESGDDGYLCARAQTVRGTLTGQPQCEDCRAAWALSVEELDTDCTGEEATSLEFAGPELYAFGDVPASLEADQPWPGEGFGWKVGFGDGELLDVGYAYPEALDAGGSGSAGLATGEVYTLWPAVAWAR